MTTEALDTTMATTEVGEPALKGQVAVVTGAGGGIGQAVCAALARAGTLLVAVDLDAEAVRQTLASIDGVVPAAESAPPHVGMAADVRREEDMEGMAQRALTGFGRIDILVACAGILRSGGAGPKLVADTSVDEWEQVVETNLTGMFLSNRAVLPAMIAQRRGSIVNLSSVSGRVGRAYDACYCASKFGVIGLSESLAEEVRQYSIRVQVVLPDAVDTPLWEQNGRTLPRPAAALPPSRVADLIVFLLSLPGDTMLLYPTIVPFHGRRRRSGAGGKEVPR
jgi:NAD(P)-dependent dehydrogenase (short-subunit alcohol dehydrogenase family)